MSFTGRCTITPQTGKVPSSQTDYAVLVSVTDNSLKSVSNGGLCRTDGYDIRAFSDSALTTALKFYRQYYDPSTGTLRMRIKIPTLSVGSAYYLGYGDNALSSDANDGPNTFSNAYSGVWPFEDGSTLNLTDITDEEFNVTNPNGATASTAILGAGASLDGSNDYLRIAPNLYPGGSVTLSCMIRSSDLSQTKVIWAKRGSMTGEAGGSEIFLLYTTAAGKLLFNMNTGVDGSTFNNSNVTGATTLSTNTNYVVHARVDGRIFLNGAEDANGSYGGGMNNSSAAIHFGDDGSAGRFFQGTFRNFEISSASRSADWITTDYNCWSNPSTFASYMFETLTVAHPRASVLLIG